MVFVVFPINRRLLAAFLPLLLLWLGGCNEAENGALAPITLAQPESAPATDRHTKPEPQFFRTVGDAFGAAVAISADGQILAIGVPGEDSVQQPVDDAVSNRSLVNVGRVDLYRYREGQWWSLGQVQAEDGASDDRFGSRLSLSADGSVLVVGAPDKDDRRRPQTQMNAGAAYVFRRYDDRWQQEAQLTASNADGFDEFASALAISADGQTLAISAPGEDGRSDQSDQDNQMINAGAVYLFHYQHGQWQQTARLKADQAGLMDNFGGAISLSADGRVLAVGADREDGYVDQQRHSNSGAVYLFEQRNDRWTLASKLQQRHADARDNFGAAVGLNADGTRLAVGAPGEAGEPVAQHETDNQAPNAGAVFIFERDHQGWLQQAYVKAPQGEANDGFGSQLQLSAAGHLLAVGAPWEDGAIATQGQGANNDAQQAGAVYVFDGTAGSWQSVATLKADNTAAFDHFGRALAMTSKGQQLVVGVANEDAGLVDGWSGFQRGAALGSGAAYVFQQRHLTWQQQHYLKSAMFMEPQLAQN